MYLLDTNVISEFRKVTSGKANKNVIAWAKNVSANKLYLSVITVLELEIGILSLEKRDVSQGALLRTWLNTHVLPTFSERILDIDTSIARCCAKLHVPNPQSDRDALIAATALVHDMTLVTRNTQDFNYPDLDILNPWN